MTQIRRTTADGKGAAELVLTVTNGKALVYRIVANATKHGAGAATIFYGQAFTGAKTANITTKDGRTFTEAPSTNASSPAPAGPHSMRQVTIPRRWQARPGPASVSIRP